MLTRLDLSNRQLAISFGILAGISIAAAFAALVLPRWPYAEPLPHSVFTSKFKQAGFQIKEKTDLPHHQSFDISTSPITRITLSSKNVLYVFNVHVRDRLNFSNDFIAKEVNPIKLTSPKDANLTFPAVQGLLDNRHVYQSCLVGDSDYGTSLSQLTALIDQQYVQSAISSLQRWFTFQPSRSYKCMHITLQSSSPHPLPESMINKIFNLFIR